MNLQNYVNDALRTESKIESVKTNAVILLNVLDMVISVGTLMDLLKKNIFYKKPITPSDIAYLVERIADRAESFPSWALGDDDKTDVSKHPQWEWGIDVDARVFHAIVGSITESAELAEALRRAIFDETPLDRVNVLEEFGDINWYQAIATDALGGSFEETLKRNIAKLKARFPEKYSDERANNRNLQVERLILEGE